ncbi:nucleotide sugar dehydrogenase [Candidatus Gottesmanbacteria bacterium]|nr:nucleotide sugar dehydrogenase [Candidatus Gottesmanbacteria bacterium]
MNTADELLKKIKSKEAKLGLIGVGYVGSAIGIGAARVGYNVLGYSRTRSRVDSINALKIDRFSATKSISDLGRSDIIAICVPTPVYKNKKPDIRPLRDALIQVTKMLHGGQLVIIESSVAPGTTRNFALPILKRSKLVEEKDFFLAYSPERIDPGNKKYTFRNIPKVVAGIGKDSELLTLEFYKCLVTRVVPVSSLETAEMVKLLENTFRFINISLINELLAYTQGLDLNIWEIIEAAATKPFGFMAHYPGPGIGGHCIAVDPYYLLDDAKKRGINLGMVEQAGKVNDRQPIKIAQKVSSLLQKKQFSRKKSKVLLIGVAYKPNISDIRESPALHIWHLLERKGHKVNYHDPFVPRINRTSSLQLSPETIAHHDVIIITTNHSSVDYEILIKGEKPVIDTRNVLGYKYPNVTGL